MDNNTLLTEVNSDNLTTATNPNAMPMVALRGKVILPSVTTTFDVGREKSLRALDAALAHEDFCSSPCRLTPQSKTLRLQTCTKLE